MPLVGQFQAPALLARVDLLHHRVFSCGTGQAGQTDAVQADIRKIDVCIRRQGFITKVFGALPVRAAKPGDDCCSQRQHQSCADKHKNRRLKLSPAVQPDTLIWKRHIRNIWLSAPGGVVFVGRIGIIHAAFLTIQARENYYPCLLGLFRVRFLPSSPSRIRRASAQLSLRAQQPVLPESARGFPQRKGIPHG